MAMTPEAATQIAKNLQEAHRLCASFYYRLFPSLDNIASELACQFKLWYPLHRDRPCKSTTHPSSKWSWDLLPMVAARIVYSNAEIDETRVGDFVYEANLIIEDAITPEFRKAYKTSGSTDPIGFPSADSYFTFCIYRAVEPMRLDIMEAWNTCKQPVANEGQFTSVGQGIEAIGFRVPLAEFLMDEAPTIQRLKTYAGVDFKEGSV